MDTTTTKRINSFNYYYRLAKNTKHAMCWIPDIKKYVAVTVEFAEKLQKPADLEIIYKP